MDNEGYPTKQELKAIKNWDKNDFLGLIEYVRQRWNWAVTACQTRWEKASKTGADKRAVLHWELHTGGWSGNESLINALLENKMFCMMWYYSWERGGHYVFKINPYNIGYITVKEYCEKHDCTRQYVSKIKDRFDWISILGQPDICKLKK